MVEVNVLPTAAAQLSIRRSVIQRLLCLCSESKDYRRTSNQSVRKSIEAKATPSAALFSAVSTQVATILCLFVVLMARGARQRCSYDRMMVVPIE